MRTQVYAAAAPEGLGVALVPRRRGHHRAARIREAPMHRPQAVQVAIAIDTLLDTADLSIEEVTNRLKAVDDDDG